MVNLLVLVWKLVWKQVILLVLIGLTIILLPNKSAFTIALSVITWQTIYLLLTKKPEIKEWSLTLFVTTTLFSAFQAVTLALGLLGAVGAFLAPIVLIMILVVWRISQSWTLYDAVTTWGAERVRGVHRKPFNLDEVRKRK